MLLWALLLSVARAEAAPSPQPGAPLALARERAGQVSDVRYELAFAIPRSTATPVTGSVTISFDLADAQRPLVLDFRRPPGTTLTITQDGQSAPFQEVNEHIVFAPQALRRGRNAFFARFTAASAPLNRSPEFLYTLLVPARAREVFPCFDQPDVKARFDLKLTLPADWQAAANGAETSRLELDGRADVRFAQTLPISTYLFAFAAGRFDVETASRDGRQLRIFHRETDAAKLARNRSAVFDLTARSLSWLEDYTGMPYPWGKFDLVLIPAFQYGGMEHPGAVFFNAGKLLLDESPTQAQQLGRAGLIAHEIAHMWFGDLVTMRWFTDVWLKEVFANFLAAKAVEPSFPGIDHALRFLMHHQPYAYKVDATQGTHPILQPLDNLNQAGLLYGAIIYSKAPVVMRHLELKEGEAALREGLRDYLKAFQFGNATWDELLAVLEKRAGRPLRAFGRNWVVSAGRPVVSTRLVVADGRIASLSLRQSDPLGRGLLWEQALEPALYFSSGSTSFTVRLQDASTSIAQARGLSAPDFVLPDRSGLGYADFRLDDKSRRALLRRVSRVPEALARGSAWLALWDDLLEGRLRASAYLDAAQTALAAETVELNIQRLLDTAAKAYWRFLPAAERPARAARLEALLWSLLEKEPSASLRKAYLKAFWSVAQTEAGVGKLRALWSAELEIPGVVLSEDDQTALALELAVRGVADAPLILERQLARLSNPDRRARLAFLAPAVSADQTVRDAFFAGLASAANRRHESWVEDALALLHHPLRAPASLKYVGPTLERLEEIQRTGDIFFPAAWVSATLEGHSSPQAARIARDFLASRPDYPAPLRRLILQSAYSLEAAARGR